MKKTLISFVMVILLFNFVYSRTILLKINNFFDSRIDVEVRKGGRFGGGGISEGSIATKTIQANERNAMLSVKGDKGDTLNIIGKFNDGSSYNFFSFSVSASTATFLTVDLKAENSQVVKDNSQYFQELMNNFFKNSIISNPIKIETDALSAFNSYLGALAIVKKDENGKYIEVDRIKPTVLKNNEEPKYSPDRSKKFEYIFESNFLNQNKVNVFGLSDVSINITTGNYYKFNYTAIGFGKVLHSDPEGKSIESRFEDIDIPARVSFLMALANDKENKYEVRVYNEALVYKGMYLKIEEYSKANLNDKINVSTIFNNEGAYSRRQDQVYEDIYGPTLLVIGFSGEDKTSYFKSKTVDYLTNLLKKLNQREITITAINRELNLAEDIGITIPDFKNRVEARSYIIELLENVEKEERQ